MNNNTKVIISKDVANEIERLKATKITLDDLIKCLMTKKINSILTDYPVVVIMKAWEFGYVIEGDKS